ncbi:MAG: hypothetical protein ACXAC7_15140, partial [Candidatus Hodarchaeales archaeon]
MATTTFDENWLGRRKKDILFFRREMDSMSLTFLLVTFTFFFLFLVVPLVIVIIYAFIYQGQFSFKNFSLVLFEDPSHLFLDLDLTAGILENGWGWQQMIQIEEGLRYDE